MKKSLIRSDVELQEGPFKGQDLNTYLYMNLPSVYLFRMSSNVMHEDGILEGDVVIVDRSLLIENGDYVVMSINGTFLLRQFLDGREPRLVCADDSIPDINLTHVDECELFGVVSSARSPHCSQHTNTSAPTWRSYQYSLQTILSEQRFLLRNTARDLPHSQWHSLHLHSLQPFRQRNPGLYQTAALQIY